MTSSSPEDIEKPVCIADTSDGPYVFVCYAHADTATVYPEIAWLNEQGVQVWYDQGIEPGSNWRSTIGDALLGASHVLFFISESSLASAHCNREIHLALDEETNVIPIYLKEVELTSDLKIGLTRIQALFYDQQEYRQRLHAAVTGSQPQVASPAKAARPAKSRRFPVIGVALFVAVLMAVLLGLPHLDDQRRETEDAPTLEDLWTIAVLPFTNRTSSDEVGFFAQGLTDAVVDKFAPGHLSVASRTQTATLVEQGLDLQSLARQLDVAYVVEGSVQQAGNDVRITAQLIRAADGIQVWSRTYDRHADGGFSMQEEVATNIASLARAKSGYDAQRTYPELYERYDGISPEAVRYYIDGQEQYEMYVLGADGDPLYAFQLTQKAAELDTNFTAAHLDIAWNYMRRVDPTLSLEEATVGAHAALDKALALDPDSVEALFYLAQTHIALDLDYASAEAAIKRGRSIEPESLWWNSFLADIAAREGRKADARRFMDMDLARAESGEEPLFLLIYAGSWLDGESPETALKYVADALKFIGDGDSDGRATALRIQAQALIELHRINEALPLIDEAWRLSGSQEPESFAYLFAATGNTGRARRLLAEAEMTANNRLHFARGYLALGEQQRVFDVIRAGIEDHDRTIVEVLLTAEYFDPLREDPRFIELVALLESKTTHTASYESAL